MKAGTWFNPGYLYEQRHKIIPRFHRILNRYGIPITSADRRLAALKNAYQGRRGFIIGTGPSLRVADLDRLKSEVSFSCNKIYLAFDQTAWRPTYYTVLDVILAKNSYAKIQQLQLNKIFSSWVKPYFLSASDISWLRHLGPSIENGKPNFQFSLNALEGVYGGWTVVYTQLQLAFYMGIREIYLLGIDFHFQVPKATGETSVHGQVIENTNEVNHFHPEYRIPKEKWTMPRLDLQHQAFLCAKKTFEAHNGAIYNASRQTALEVFPRIDFDQLSLG